MLSSCDIIDVCDHVFELLILHWHVMPDSDCLVSSKSTRCDPVAHRVARDGDDGIGVTSQLLHDFFCLEIPKIDQVVFRAAHDPFSAGDREG